MASSRKSSASKKSKVATSARSKKAPPARKVARPKAAVAKARTGTSTSLRANEIKKAARTAKAAKLSKAAQMKGKAKAAGKKVIGKPAVKAVRKPVEVHPIGMLPPSLIARANAKSSAPAPRTVVRQRPAAAPAAHPGVQTVTEQDIKSFETRLLEERQRILKEMGHLESTVFKVNQRDSAGDLSGYAFHMADAGTDAMEREKAFLFASAEGRTLMEIDEALRRLYQDAYGMCESCGKPIGRARLQAIPQARLCVSCKEKEEKAGRGAV